MWLSSATSGQSALIPTSSGNINTSFNRVTGITGVTYDSAGLGRVVVAGSSNLTYDAEGRVVSDYDSLAGSTTNYTFDGLGQRITKGTVGNVTTTYLYDAFGNLAAEYTPGTIPSPPCDTCYISDDALGNTRMVTDQTGAVAASHDYYPFGTEVAGQTAGRTNAWGTTDDISQKFTGQERDSETDLDHFPARHFASAMGRFMTPDPAGNLVAEVTNPQSWNMYGYALNSPLVYIDPTGLDPTCYVDGFQTSCNTAWQMVYNGGAAQCPNNQCVLATQNGFFQFVSYATGLSGYAPFNQQNTQNIETLIGGTYQNPALTATYFVSVLSGTPQPGQPFLPQRPGKPAPDWSKNSNCQYGYLNRHYGAGAAPFVSRFSLLGYTPLASGPSSNASETVLPTVVTEGAKIGTVAAFKAAGSAAGAEAAGLMSFVPGLYGTLLDAEAKFMCKDVTAGR